MLYIISIEFFLSKLLEMLIEENVEFTYEEEQKINGVLGLVNKLYE